jgi:hypothetical protein
MVGCTEPNSTMDSENIVLEKLDTAKLVATVDTAAVDTPFDIWADTRVTTEEGVNEANDIENCGTALAVVDTGTTVLTSATCILRSNTRRAETTTIWLQHNKATSRYTPHSHSLIGTPIIRTIQTPEGRQMSKYTKKNVQRKLQRTKNNTALSPYVIITPLTHQPYFQVLQYCMSLTNEGR